jgi:HEAT repeat protein
MDPAAVSALIESLLKMGATAVPLLQRMALDPTTSGDHRLPALLAMSQSDNPGYGKTLITVSGDPDPVIRREAAVALLKLRPPEGLEALEVLSRDSDKGVSLTAQEGIKVWKTTANAMLNKEGTPKPAPAPAR